MFGIANIMDGGFLKRIIVVARWGLTVKEERQVGRCKLQLKAVKTDQKFKDDVKKAHSIDDHAIQVARRYGT